MIYLSSPYSHPDSGVRQARLDRGVLCPERYSQRPTTNASTTWKKHDLACSNTSKSFTIISACTRRSDTYRPIKSKPFTPRLLRRNLLAPPVSENPGLAG